MLKNRFYSFIKKRNLYEVLLSVVEEIEAQKNVNIEDLDSDDEVFNIKIEGYND